MSSRNSKRRKDYISSIQSAYQTLKNLHNYQKLEHHGKLEQTLLEGRKIQNGELIDILQLSVIHDIHGERDPDSEKKEFEHEYSRCITSLDDEFETRLTFVDAIIKYARGPGNILNGRGMRKWRNIKKQLKDLRDLIKKEDLPISKAQVYFADQIDRSRETLFQFSLYLSQAYHLPRKS